MTFKRIDSNQHEIVKGLRDGNASVINRLASLGHGIFDIVVGFNGVTYPVEIKNGSKSPSQRGLTQDQVKFHRDWKGSPILLMESLRDVELFFEGQYNYFDLGRYDAA